MTQTVYFSLIWLFIAPSSYLTAHNRPNRLDKSGLEFAASDECLGLSDGWRQQPRLMQYNETIL